ncbi:30S ribosomal protein S6e [archaeon]|nr:30S ribosomal protein S6e [archaeon]
MVFKFNIGEKSGKTWKLEAEAENLIDKKLKETIDGKIISDDLEGYELEITGASDKAGFTAMENIEGIGLKKALLSYGKGMKKKPKREGKKKLSNSKPKGLRLRKTVRANTITSHFTQINLKVVKAGKKPLNEIFPDQNKAPETQTEAQ